MSRGLQTFRGATIQHALAQVKKALGRDAVILGTRAIEPRLGGLMGAARVEITAAPGTPVEQRAGKVPAPVPSRKTVPLPATEPPRPLFDAAPRSERGTPLGLRSWEIADDDDPIAPAKTPPRSAAVVIPVDLQPWYEQMVRNEVGEALATRLVNNAVRKLSPQQRTDTALIRNEIIAEVESLLPAGGEITLEAQGRQCAAFVGPPGCGKTATIAKLAAHFALREKRRVLILSLDTYRLATHIQMRHFGEMIGVEVLTAQTVAGVRGLAGKLSEAEVVLVDTPGVGLRDQGRFVRVAALLRALKPDDLHLVLPASLAGPVQTRIAEQFGRLGRLRLLLTHLDETLGMGAVVDAAQRLHLTLSYLCDGQRVPTDLRPARPREVAERLLATGG